MPLCKKEPWIRWLWARECCSLENGPILADILIAADRANSPVARCLFGHAFDHAKIGFALEVEIDDLPNADSVRIDLGAAQRGYGWQFPETIGTTVGVGGLLAQNNDLKSSLAQYLQELENTNV
jgi:flavin-dependent dehydrogenase